MRYAVILAVVLLAYLPGVGQTFFFDKMAKAPWAIANFTSVAALLQTAEIQLYDTTADSVRITTCTFGSQLLIRSYNPQLGRVATLASYVYQIDRNHSTITVSFTKENAVTYDIGITSTGKFAVLLRKRRQPKVAG